MCVGGTVPILSYLINTMDSTLVTCEAGTNYDSEDEAQDLASRPHLYQRWGHDIVFVINSGSVEVTLNVCMWGLTPKELMEFVTALETGGKNQLTFIPGSNSDCTIATVDGSTSFSLYSAGGNNPADFSISVANRDVLPVFKKLLS